MGFPGGSVVKNPPANAEGFDPWSGKVPWGRKCQPAPVFLLGKSHGQRRLAGYSPKDLETLPTATSVFPVPLHWALGVLATGPLWKVPKLQLFVFFLISLSFSISELVSLCFPLFISIFLSLLLQPSD